MPELTKGEVFAARLKAAALEVPWWHEPVPGPWPVWDWRCRVCSEPVADHPNLVRRLLGRWRARRGEG